MPTLGQADREFALEGDALTDCDLAEDALTAEASRDDLRMIRRRCQVAKQDGVDIRPGA